MNEKETPNLVIRLRQDGILEFRYKDRAEESLADARWGVSEAAELLGDGGPVPTMVVFGKLMNVSGKARAYFAGSEEVSRVISRAALIVETPVSRVIGNIFVGLNKPNMPVKLFTDEEKAVAWLKSHAS